MSRKIIKMVFQLPSEYEGTSEEFAVERFGEEAANVFVEFDCLKVTNDKSEIRDSIYKEVKKKTEVLQTVLDNITGQIFSFTIKENITASEVRDVIVKHEDLFKRGVHYSTEIYNQETDDELFGTEWFDNELDKEDWYLAEFKVYY